METDSIRFKLYIKYTNQKEKLNAINNVLSSLKKKQLTSLDENDLFLNIELYKERCSFPKKQNIKVIKLLKT